MYCLFFASKSGKTKPQVKRLPKCDVGLLELRQIVVEITLS